MSPRLYLELQQLAKERKAKEGLWSDPGYVFLSTRGKRLQERNVNRSWYRLRTRAAEKSVRPLRLHCTRHTFATLALEAGRSIPWVSKILGHAQVATTLNVYAHFMPNENDSMDFVPGASGPRMVPDGPKRIEESRK